MSMARCLVMTNCTNRKRVAAGTPLSLEGLEAASIAELGDRWRQRLDAAPARISAKRLYVGRSFVDALAVADSLDARLYVISAGLGLVPQEVEVPNYDATISDGSGSIKTALRRFGARTADWWGAINGGSRTPIADLIRKSSGPALIALSAVYLEMIAEDLEAIAPGDVERVRIFSSSVGAAKLASRLTGVVMPYDDRLEGSPSAGTRADFPQRAMRHFVEALGAQDLDLPTARSRVEASLSQYQSPALPIRTRKTDDEIVGLLRENWNRFGGSSSKLLRFLRDEAEVACEQSRFRGLWLSIRSSAADRKGAGHG